VKVSRKAEVSGMRKVRNNMKYFWSFNKDDTIWNGGVNSVEQCIEEAREERKDEEFVFIGELEKHTPKIDAYWIIEYLLDTAYEECGEVAEGWLVLSKDEMESLEIALNEALKKWLVENNQETYFGAVKNIRRYRLENEEPKWDFYLL
jgi:hypothetical protein